MKLKITLLIFIIIAFLSGCGNSDVKPSVNNTASEANTKSADINNLSSPSEESIETPTNITNTAMPQTSTTQNSTISNATNSAYKGMNFIYETQKAQNTMKKINDQGIQCLQDKIKDIFASVASTYEIESSKIKIIDARFEKIAHSAEDMIILLEFCSSNYTHNNKAVILLVKNEVYEAKYADIGDVFKYEVYDIDGDGVNEVFVKRDNNYESIEHGLKVLQYRDGMFLGVFDGSCANSALHSRYMSDFTYSVVNNKKHKKYKDIIFNINTKDTKESPEKDNPELNKEYPLKDSIHFSYNGRMYLQNKKINGYINFRFNNLKFVDIN
ncbi:MAG: hypothetical protein Q8942_12525 [Bacillota bacterium]|nr:hypothetical protein [Bacillota bacterium]